MPLEFGLKDFIDIFLVALMLFYCYKVMKESRSLNVFFGVLIFVVFWLFVSQILEMKLLGSILDKLVSVGTLALIILFQEEIRNFFSRSVHTGKWKASSSSSGATRKTIKKQTRTTSCPSSWPA